jgi:hypothetical protein
MQPASNIAEASRTATQPVFFRIIRPFQTTSQLVAGMIASILPYLRERKQ